MVPDANPEEVEGSDQGKIVQIYPGFIKLLPKLTEERVIAKSIFELKNRSIGYLPAEDIDDHFHLQPRFDPLNSSVEYLIIRRNKDNDSEGKV